jgi:hypothetical protein
MSHDILSDVLRGIRLRSAIFFYLSYGREWATGAPAAAKIASAVLPGAEHVMEYHVVTKGAAWLASTLLSNSNTTIASIALEVGYESEAAFTRAFKRFVGAPPATWRRRKSQR